MIAVAHPRHVAIGDDATATAAELQSTFDAAKAGQDSQAIAIAATQLATALSRNGDFSAAQATLADAIATIDESPQPAPPNLADALIQLGDLQLGNSDYPAAATNYARAIEFNEQTLGPQHIAVAIALDRRAQLHVNLSEFAKAEALFGRAARIRERTLGTDHPDTALGHDNLARLNIARGNVDAAQQQYRQALAIRRTHWGDTHEAVAVSLDRLAELALETGNPDAAITYAEEALAIRINLLGIDAPDVLQSRQDLAALRDTIRRRAQPTVGAAGPGPGDEPLPDTAQTAAATAAPPPAITQPTADFPPIDPVETAGSAPAFSAPKPVEVAIAPVTQPVAEPADPAPAAPAGRHVIQLGAFRSAESVQTEWQRLTQQFAAELDGLTLQMVKADLGDRGIFYRVRTGPFSADQANATCASFERQDQPCLVVAP